MEISILKIANSKLGKAGAACMAATGLISGVSALAGDYIRAGDANRLTAYVRGEGKMNVETFGDSYIVTPFEENGRIILYFDNTEYGTGSCPKGQIAGFYWDPRKRETVAIIGNKLTKKDYDKQRPGIEGAVVEAFKKVIKK